MRRIGCNFFVALALLGTACSRTTSSEVNLPEATPDDWPEMSHPEDNTLDMTDGSSAEGCFLTPNFQLMARYRV